MLKDDLAALKGVHLPEEIRKYVQDKLFQSATFGEHVFSEDEFRDMRLDYTDCVRKWLTQSSLIVEEIAEEDFKGLRVMW